MKALTLTQPYATLIAIGEKTTESRSWYTSYRGPLAIHAAKGWSRDDTLLCLEEPFKSALLAGGIKAPGGLPLGFIVATCRLITCRPTQGIAGISDQERDFGDYSPGRWAWILTDIVALPEPVPARGSLGLWEWEPGQLEGNRETVPAMVVPAG